ncbi:MAG: gliding motility-associated C-terminal domain-containing protein [Flavobacteriales bacterium]|nr:gliding motility-associated C-terminal domain-containing protein [Flavobacteriales bacterium]
MPGNFTTHPWHVVRWACLLTAGVLCAVVDAQPYWARKAASPGNEHIADVQVDADGSIYVTGEYGGTLQFGGQSVGSQGGLDVFVARLDAAGSLIWMRTGGGTGIDRGIKLSLGNGTALAVAGEFMGTANLFGTSLTSAGGTADAFVAVLNKSDGTLQWVRQGGGTGGTDSPGGISMGQDGRVTVAGQFRGTATWESTTLVSTLDPLTSLPSADVFIATYSPTGSLLWLKQGAANKDDKAVEVVHDADGNLFVTGQYSNTITFDQTYPNILANASFLLRLAPDGSDVWFRRMGGAAYNHVRDLAIAPSGQLLITGDQQGTMVWSGTTTVNVSSAQPFAYYLLKVDANGQLDANITVGSTSGVTVAAVAAQGNNVAVFGAFNCQFTGLADLYASDALFMATGTEDLFVSVHALADLAVQEAQQFGGRSGKSAGGMAYLPQGELVFSGSFQQNLIFPASGIFSGEVVGFNQGGSGSTGVMDWCGHANYGSFYGCEGAGLVDGFVARGYVPERAPYDWWVRSEGDCELVRNEPCIPAGLACGDTITACGQLTLSLDPHFAYHANAQVRYVGPPLTFLWSTGSTNANIIATSSGTYWVDVSTANGCWQWSDTIEVVIHPLPPVTWLSIDGAPAHAPPFGFIHLCEPQISSMVASNLPDSGSWWWSVPYGTDPIYGDSIGVDTSGTYAFSVVNEFGCMRSQPVIVIDDPTIPMPDIGLEMQILFPQDMGSTDSLWLCYGSPLEMTYVPAWSIDGVPVDSLPAGLTVSLCHAPCTTGAEIGQGPYTSYHPAVQSGWMVFNLQVTVDNAPCAGDTLVFTGIDSVFVNLFPPLNVDVQLAGPAALCDGDTVLLTATCTGCDELLWWANGTGEAVDDDTYRAWAAGPYGITGLALDTNGCNASDMASILLTTPSGPVLNVVPANGILCPGDSAVITSATAGTDAVWYGPQGPVAGQGVSLTTAVPGLYYLSLIVQGCPVTSNSVALTSYGTPYLAGGETLALCYPGDEVTIQVMTVPGAVVQWMAPLAGNALSQVVDQPGTYTCSVTACGIVTPLSMAVVDAPVEAGLLTPGPFALCPGDTLLLQAAPGADTYLWMPGLVAGPQLEVAQAGTYSVAVSNAEGCSDTSVAVMVEDFFFSEPVQAMGDTVCAGDVAQLLATGSGTFLWYANTGTGAPLGGGSPFPYMPTASSMLYVRQLEGTCLSAADSAWVQVAPRPPAVWATGPDSLCVGEPLLLTINGPDSVVYNWSTPGGAFQGALISIPAVDVADMGSYVCTPAYGDCNGVPVEHGLSVHAPQPTGLPEEVMLCTGGMVTLQLPPSFTSVLWSNGSTWTSLTITAAMELSVQAVDMHGCHTGGDVRVVMDDCDLVIPNVFSPNGDGINDRWFPTGGFVSAMARIWNRWGGLVHEGDLLVRGWNGRHHLSGDFCSDGVYYYELTLTTSDGTSMPLSGYLQLQGRRP